MNFSFPETVYSDYEGYACLIDFFSETTGISNEKITLDFSITKWFDGNLCAVIGAIRSGLSERNNTLEIVGLSEEIKTTFTENYFLGINEIQTLQNIDSAIYYIKLEPNQEKEFADYVEKLMSVNHLPEMSERLKTKINRSILEIFNNAKSHGQSKNIFSCGQYYPNSMKLDFTIVDLGDTIRLNVRNYLKNLKLSATKSIDWAVQEGNTTRAGNVPGGLGFSLIREFFQLNNGCMEIISSNGFWQERKGNSVLKFFGSIFVGTIVNLEFNLNDTNSYILAEEVITDTIF
jgi:hypothetical protein